MKRSTGLSGHRSYVRFISLDTYKSVKHVEETEKGVITKNIPTLLKCIDTGKVRSVVESVLDIHAYTPSGFDDRVVALLCGKVLDNFPANPTVILPTARCCIAAKKRGLVTDIGPVEKMLYTLLPHAETLPNIYVARSIRASSALNFSTEMRALLVEASKDYRLSSYSAMDLSELVHSLQCIRSKCLESEEESFVTSFLRDLLLELSTRGHMLRVRNEVAHYAYDRASNPQQLSFIAVSNILFSLRDIGSSECRSVLRDVLISREFTEDDAYRGASVFHLVSVCDSLLLTNAPTDKEADWKVYKRILKELDRKMDSTNDQSPFVESCVRRLVDRYGRKKILLGFIS